MNDLKHDARELEALGHEVVKRAIREGRAVVARTPSEVRALGLAAAQGRLPEAVGGMVAKKIAQSSPAPRKATTVQTRKPAPTATPKNVPAQQVRAGVSGAVDEFTLGAADHVLSAGDAILDGGLQGFGDRYDANMREKRAEDAYDSENYGAARTAGRVVGFGAGMAAMGGVGMAGRAALSRTPQAARLMARVARTPKLKVGVDPRGLVQLAAGGGAGVGVGVQAVEDAASGRLSSPGQYGAAALGGATDGLATLRYGPARGGAMGAAVDSMAGDLAEGRMPSVENAVGAAHGGAVLGRAGDLVGTYGIAAQPAHIKGNVGETLSLGKTLGRGKIPNLKKDDVDVGNGLRSQPDQVIDGGYVEAKMGPGAGLTKNQKRLRAKARREGDEFIIDAWQFRDVGKAGGIVAAPTGEAWIDEDGTPWQGR
jgi:hypothetical protein